MLNKKMKKKNLIIKKIKYKKIKKQNKIDKQICK